MSSVPSLTDLSEKAANVDSASSTQTVVLLGASNLRISLQTVVSTLRSMYSDLSLFVACGHGRSYGQWSAIPFRALPGITQSELWPALEKHLAGLAVATQSPPPKALITDVGNDIVFGVPVPQILEWVAICCDAFHQARADLIITLPPRDRLERLSDLHFKIARTIIFPRSRITRGFMLETVEALRSGLLALAERSGATVIDPPVEWYGIDPIHIRRGVRPGVWKSIFAQWPVTAAVSATSMQTVSLPRGLMGMRPHYRRYFGREQHTPQPVHHANGLRLELY